MVIMPIPVLEISVFFGYLGFDWKQELKDYYDDKRLSTPLGVDFIKHFT